MKNILLIFLINMIPFSVMPQKVEVQVVKRDNIARFEWQILDKNYKILFSGDKFLRTDSAVFSLDADNHYILKISVSEIYDRKADLCKLILNDEPIILVKSEIDQGDHFFPFYTGVHNHDVKITGGTTALISDFPWQVYLIAGNRLCGGSIIGDKWILTAAHCTLNSQGNPIPASSMSVKVGSNNPNNPQEGQTYFVSEVITNQSYDDLTHENDIALLKLTQPVNYPNAAPIKLITSDDVKYGETDPGVMSWVTGWGLTHVNPNVTPSSLQKVQLPVVSNEQAAAVWGTIPSTDIMAGYLNGNKDACNGDSGGPMVVPVVNEYKLAGIVSWGSINCNTYGGYSRVSYFESWIRANSGIVKEYSPPAPTGDTLVCQGVEASPYSIDNLTGATAYEWKLLPAAAGTVTWNSNNATVLWNTDFAGSAELLMRVTINNVVSEWSRLDLKVVLNTRLLSQSNDTTLCTGQPITFKIGAEGYNLIYKYYKNGTLVQSGSSSQFSIPVTTRNNSGSYVCQISGYCGTVSSGSMNLTVLPLTKISFVSPDVQVPSGSNVTLQVNADGDNLSYKWQKDNVLLENRNTSVLNLYYLNAPDIGLYRATVKGTCGTEISKSVYVYVKTRNYSIEPEVFLWPSVTSDEFNVALSNDSYYTIYINNMTGQLIRELRDCRYQTVVNLNTTPRGIYIISVFNTDFRKTLRVIKK
jgi:hypothetical protein